MPLLLFLWLQGIHTVLYHEPGPRKFGTAVLVLSAGTAVRKPEVRHVVILGPPALKTNLICVLGRVPCGLGFICHNQFDLWVLLQSILLLYFVVGSCRIITACIDMILI